MIGLLFFLAAAVLPVSFTGPAGAGSLLAGEELFDELTADELRSGRFFAMVDEQGRTVLITGRRLGVKDRFLNADNELYEVISVDGYLARARFVEKVTLDTAPGSAAAEGVAPVQQEIRPAYKIAIYHSHNAESYVPSDGTDSIYGAGGIHGVGLAFKEALEKKGVDVLYSEQLHLPHDRGAYRRSRVTALRLIRERPDAIFDLHRDAAPWEKYAVELDGETATQIQIVVGLSNPGASTNEKFAYDLKGYADRIYPGLIHGVLLIWGSYNQDISPLALLLEVGAHTNTKEAAQRGIARFADVVSYYFYGPAFLKDTKIAPGPRPPEGAPAGRSQYGIMRAFSGTILSLLLISTGAALGFYFLNNPGALAELYLRWEELPGKAAVLGKRVRAYWGELPLQLKKVRRAAPLNLRLAWEKLCREGAAVPRLFRRLRSQGRQLGRRILAAGALLYREAPLNLRRGWRLLRRESRELPRRIREGLKIVKKKSGLARRRASRKWRELGSKVSLHWNEAVAEAAILLGKFRESLSTWRNRLRP